MARSGAKKNRAGSGILKGLLAAVGVTVLGVVVFALLMQWLNPSDTAIRVFNQLLKLTSIAVGVLVAVGRGGDNGLARGAAVGLLYMGVGVALYAVLSGQGLPLQSYLADLAMGVAGGGLEGILMANWTAK